MVLKRSIPDGKTLPENSLSELTKDTINNLVEIIEEQKPVVKSRIGINHVSGTSLIDLKDICYLKGDGAYTFLHLANGGKVIATRNIGDFEKTLSEENFLRIHKSTIVNLDYVKEVKKNLRLSVLLLNDAELQVSRRNAKLLSEKFRDYARTL